MRRTITAPRHFTDEEIARANRVSILEVARQYGFEPDKEGSSKKAIHMKHSGGLYVFPETNRFFQHTTGVKGSVTDFIMLQDGIAFPEAVAKLIGEDYTIHTREGNYTVKYSKEEKGPLELPAKAENFKRAYWYLVSHRGIDPQIVSEFMNRKMIYQEAKYGNCVFVGYDKDSTPKYCSMRAARADSSFKMDAVNSDKSYPFFHEGKNDIVIVNEAPIDLLSHATLTKLFGGDWQRDHRISLGCTWEGALDRYLTDHPNVCKIVIALDNDYLARNKDGVLTNWGQEAANRIYAKYTERGYDCAIHQPHLNDFNLDLTEIRKGKTTDDLDRQRETELRAEFEKSSVDEPEDYRMYDKDEDMVM